MEDLLPDIPDKNPSKSQNVDLLPDIPDVNNTASSNQSQGFGTPKDLALGFGQGVANIPTGVGNLGIWAAHKALNTPESYLPYFNFAPDNTAAHIGEFGSWLVPGGALGKAGKLMTSASAFEKIPAIARAVQGASEILKGSSLLNNSLTKNALLGGIMAQNPNEIGSNIALGIGMGGLLPALKGASSGIKSLKGLLEGGLSKEELANNFIAARGTETPIGEVLQSPALKKGYENYLGHLPGSGVTQAAIRTEQAIKEKGQGILDTLLGEHAPGSEEETINTSLRKAKEHAEKQKTELYKGVNERANKEDFELNVDPFLKKVKEHSDFLQDTNLLKKESKPSKLLAKLLSYEQGAVKTTSRPFTESEIEEMSPQEKIKYYVSQMKGSKLKSPQGVTEKKSMSLLEANILKSHFREMAERIRSNPNSTEMERSEANIWDDLSRSLKGSIVKSMKSGEHHELLREYNAAEKNYGENFAPFLEKHIRPYTTGKADSDTIIQHFLDTSKSTDKANLLSKIIEKLPEDKQKLFAHGYLKRALVEKNGVQIINPIIMKNLISRLGPRQMQVLFKDPAIRDEIKQYMNLVDKNQEALGIRENPKTGARTLSAISHFKGQVGTGAGLGYLAGGLPGAVIGAVGLPAISAFAAKTAGNAARSEAVRESIVKHLLRKKK